MSRFRLTPTAEQEARLLVHCAHARFVWNLAVEQHSHWRPGRPLPPGYVDQARQLTEIRAEHPWLREGSVTVQQQALRDFAQAVRNFFGGTHGKPTWRRAAAHQGFRQVAVRPEHVRKLNRRRGAAWIPKVGWVRFHWSRRPPAAAKSYRVTRDGAGRWHIAFAAVPAAIPAPGDGGVVGIDRGVAVSAALSTGELLRCPGLSRVERTRARRLRRRLARATRGSHRHARLVGAIARLTGRESARRKDWVEKVTTRLAREFDLIRVEDLRIADMTRSARGNAGSPGRQVRQKSGLNRAILAQGWGLLVSRLADKAPGRVEKVPAAFTSQRCSACGHVAPESRESQAVFRCVACGYHDNADVNAARNIAAGRAVAARGGGTAVRPVNREPRRPVPAAGGRNPPVG
ncbi:RNA-guided endonuclease TnpB family protein [Amycolatopsis sp. SID8362]|uniref:RNA-guided endonuclease InsQ/TnpB family protein n=1 Tax=Amycolatopsis sp. SID8362 TaxID=2690346 RepID=UPI00136B38EE|nr:RNA-guided endonuclease TnpB family protein [Amycolatopsis sp. SID8362]NBH01702.1 transposase [Amycolatopsis sp. SID8362]NED38403.1 transposase [Amycolatopsis sp. SID8362]